MRWVIIGVGLLAANVVVGEERFTFVVPGDDATASATDFSGLSPRPAGEEGFVRVRDGHFHTDAGRVRFWGVNTTFSANFPTHEEGERVAAHLAKLGVNAVRMHHHDMQDAPGGIWGGYEDGRRVFDPEQVDRQDYFLDRLHRHGIYANLNLHVSRTFSEREGFVTEGLPSDAMFDKYVLYFDPAMRRLFKGFCREYLTHTNPYRGMRRVDDPAIAMVEITNENSFSTRGPGLAWPPNCPNPTAPSSFGSGTGG